MAGLWGPQIMAFYKAHPDSLSASSWLRRLRLLWLQNRTTGASLRWCSLHLRFCLATG